VSHYHGTNLAKAFLYGSSKYLKEDGVIVKALGSAVVRIESYRVDVEVDVSPGLLLFSTVGLLDVAVKESRDRIKAAIKNSGYSFPPASYHGQSGPG
jgi:hypothetical protein